MKRKLMQWLRWLRDMFVFVFVFWAITAAGWTLAGLALDAAMHELDVSERRALDAQGRAAWDRYCESVARGDRHDDLGAANGECSQFEWAGGEGE